MVERYFDNIIDSYVTTSPHPGFKFVFYTPHAYGVLYCVKCFDSMWLFEDEILYEASRHKLYDCIPKGGWLMNRHA